MRLGGALLAAGRGSRYAAARPGAGNKLLAPFEGKPLVCHAMDALAAAGLSRVAVVTGEEAIAALARERGFGVVWNERPEMGQGYSVALGVSALSDLDGALLLAADQPRVSARSLRALIRAFSCGGKGLACLEDGTHWGNPALFGAPAFPALAALRGDAGAKRLLLANEGDLLRVPCAPGDSLFDADTPGDFLGRMS